MLRSATFLLLRDLTTIKTTIQIIIIIIQGIPKPMATYKSLILPTVFVSGYLLEVLVSVAKFVALSVVAASAEGKFVALSVLAAAAEGKFVALSFVAASAEGVVDSAGAEEDDDVWSSGVSVGLTVQFRSEYISAL
jgi:hypothetical protein